MFMLKHITSPLFSKIVVDGNLHIIPTELSNVHMCDCKTYLVKVVLVQLKS